MVLVTGKPRDQMAVGSDITRILVDPFQTSWRALRDMQLPMNVKKIVDIAPASNAYGRGSVFYPYRRTTMLMLAGSMPSLPTQMISTCTFGLHKP